MKVKKRNIINKLNQKLSTIRVSPQRNEHEKNYSSLVDYQIQASRGTEMIDCLSPNRNENYLSHPVKQLDLNKLGAAHDQISI